MSVQERGISYAHLLFSQTGHTIIYIWISEDESIRVDLPPHLARMLRALVEEVGPTCR